MKTLITVYVDVKTKEALEKKAGKEGTSVSALVDEIIKEVLKEKR